MRSYHTLLKEAVRLDKCPPGVVLKIPAANISRWKKEPPGKYFSGGMESVEKYSSLLESIQHQPGLFFAYARVIRTFSCIFQRSADFFKILRQQQEEVVQVILRVKALLKPQKALKDIIFSNSMVEAVNKQLKYNSLFRKRIEDFAALQKETDGFFEEYNAERPHYVGPAEKVSGASDTRRRSEDVLAYFELKPTP